MDEVRSGGIYLSQNDLQVHFGLGSGTSATLEVRWLGGDNDEIKVDKVNRILTLTEGKGE